MFVLELLCLTHRQSPLIDWTFFASTVISHQDNNTFYVTSITSPFDIIVRTNSKTVLSILICTTVAQL
jgi:hypothetical protein